MSLRIENHRVVHINETVLVHVLDVILHDVSSFAFGMSEIPGQPVIDRRSKVGILSS